MAVQKYGHTTKSRLVAIGLILNYYRPGKRTDEHTDGEVLLWRCEDKSKKTISSSMRIVLLNGWNDCDHPCRISQVLDSLKYMLNCLSFTMNLSVQEMTDMWSDFFEYFSKIAQNTTDDLKVTKKWNSKASWYISSLSSFYTMLLYPYRPFVHILLCRLYNKCLSFHLIFFCSMNTTT